MSNLSTSDWIPESQNPYMEGNTDYSERYRSWFADDSADWSCATHVSREAKKPRRFRGSEPRSRGVESPTNRIGSPTGDLANRGGSRRPGLHREKSLRSLRGGTVSRSGKPLYLPIPLVGGEPSCSLRGTFLAGDLRLSACESVGDH